MKKTMIGSLLSAGFALAIGFYAGSQWQGAGSVDLRPEQGPSQSSARSGKSPEAASAMEAGRATDACGTLDAVRPPAPDGSIAWRERTHQDALLGARPDPGTTRAWEPVVSGFDREKLEETYQQVFGGDANRRHQALRTLAQLGADEVKPYLIEIASDEDEDSETRRDLIQQIDWSGDTQELGNILVGSRDAEARLAAVAASSGETLTEVERTGLEDVMLENLEKEPSDGVKIATLNYFLSTDPLAFEQIVTQYRDELATPEVQQYLEFIVTPPDQMLQEPTSVEGSGN